MQMNIHYQFLDALKLLPFVEEIWLFGSRARGDHHPKSDLDLAILCPKATEKEWLQVLEIVDNADTLLKIDCLRFAKDHISETLYKKILQEKKILYAKN